MKIYKISTLCDHLGGNIFAHGLYEKRWYGWKLIYRSGGQNVRLMKNHLLVKDKFYSEINNPQDE
jgi:hypothetical protein